MPAGNDLRSRATAALAALRQRRLLRAAARYSTANAGLLAGGIAFSALFSLVAALTITWTVFLATLGDHPGLRRAAIDSVNTVLPGVLQDGSGSGLIDPDALILRSAVNPASVIATGVLVWTAVSIMTNIRTGVQAMFGLSAAPVSFARQKALDLLGFAGMTIGIVASSALGTATGTLGAHLLRLLRLDAGPALEFLLRAAGFTVAAAIAAATFAALFRVTAGIRAPWRDLCAGSCLGGVAVQVVLTAGTSLVSSASSDPLLAASAGIATLLLFVNLLSRVLLFVAAWTANPPAPVKPSGAGEAHFRETPNYLTLSEPRTLSWPHEDATGQIQVTGPQDGAR